MGGVGGPRVTTNYHPEVVGSIPFVRIFFLFPLSLLFLRVRPNGTVVPRTWAFPCCRCFLFFSACHRRGKYRTPKQAIFGAKKGAQSAIGHFFEHRPRARKKAAWLWRHFFDCCLRQYEKTGPKSAVLKRNFTLIFFCLSPSILLKNTQNKIIVTCPPQ